MTTWKLTPKGEAMANQLSLELANPCQKGTKEWEQWSQGVQDAISLKPPAQPFFAYLEGFQWGVSSGLNNVEVLMMAYKKATVKDLMSQESANKNVSASQISSAAWRGLELLAKHHGMRNVLELIEAIGDGRLKIGVDEDQTRAKLAEYETYILQKAKNDIDALIRRCVK